MPHGVGRGAPGVRCTCVRKVPWKPWGDSPVLVAAGGLGGRRIHKHRQTKRVVFIVQNRTPRFGPPAPTRSVGHPT